MVKDGWSQATSYEVSNNSTANPEQQGHMGLKNTHFDTMGNNGMNTGNGQSANSNTPPGASVWGVYESREKLIEMHIC